MITIVEKTIAIVGAGPSALFLIKAMLDNKLTNVNVDIFEKSGALGKGMPYSEQGACNHHMANVSSDELPHLPQTLLQWMKGLSNSQLNRLNLMPSQLHEKRVVSRLILGQFLESQFKQLLAQATIENIKVNVHLNTEIIDVKPKDHASYFELKTAKKKVKCFDFAIICTGHTWPKNQELSTSGFYDSPYPPSKLTHIEGGKFALKGSSLTAVDAIKTIANANGSFNENGERFHFVANNNKPKLSVEMFLIDGALPCVRYHLQNPLLSSEGLLNKKEIEQHRLKNNGFVSLDYLFEKNFKDIVKSRDENFYYSIANKNLEQFVEWILSSRQAFDPFVLLKVEYIQARQSIEQATAIHWKECLEAFSYSINAPAKYFSAEDMIRLKTVLQPLIAPIIAHIPQSSAKEILALHDANILSLTAVKDDAELIVEGNNRFVYEYSNENTHKCRKRFSYFIDCTGQASIPIKYFPFESILKELSLLETSVKFKDGVSQELKESNFLDSIFEDAKGDVRLKLSGFQINDDYQFICNNNKPINNLFIMAVPFISGCNPDYSGIDFCEKISATIVKNIVRNI